MTSIKLTRKLGGNDAGATITVTPGIAHNLIEAGVAEEVKATRKTTAKAKTDDTDE
jgi:hypothetical protein